MPRAIALFVAISLWSVPARADAPNVVAAQPQGAGAASQLVLSQRLFRRAIRSGDPVLLLAAIRLARGVVKRPAIAWSWTTTGETPAPDAEGSNGPADPADAANVATLQGLAIDDPDLQDLVYDLDAQLPAGRLPVATVAEGDLSGGAQDDWRLPLSGSVAAELALIGDGDTSLSLTVADETGAIVCATPATVEPGLCRFVPARNGYFSVRIRNEGRERNRYLLVGN